MFLPKEVSSTTFISPPRLLPRPLAGQAVVTGLVHSSSPPPLLVFILIEHASGSAFLLRVDYHRILQTRALGDEKKRHFKLNLFIYWELPYFFRLRP